MEKSLRILHVISNLNAGGAEKMVVTAANLFVGRGHEVGVALLIEKGPLVDQLDKRIKLHLVSRKSRFDWKALASVTELSNTYDVVHVHLKHNLKFLFVANLLHKIKSAVILHDHSAEVLITGVPKTNLPFFILRWLRKQTYIGVSEKLVTWAIQNFKLNPQQSFALPNAIACSTEDKGTVVRRSDTTLRLLLVSNFRRIKNIEFGVSLISHLVQKGVNVTLDILGQELDKEYYKEVVALMNTLSVTDRIRIDTTVVDIAPQLMQYDLAIHCSKAETGPLVLLEYLCAGLPFVSIAEGEVAETVNKKFPELITHDYSLDAWCETIQQLDLTKYHSVLKEFFETEFSIDIYYQRLLAIYTKILGV